MKRNAVIIMVLSLVGLTDASYLTYEHYAQLLPPCSVSVFVDCGKVLHSSYALVWGIPLALFGVGYYAAVLLSSLCMFAGVKHLPVRVLLVLTTMGFISSLYFVYLQLAVLHAICLYCMLSALVSTALFLFCHLTFSYERQRLIAWLRALSRRPSH